jgi:hypothetical protein
MRRSGGNGILFSCGPGSDLNITYVRLHDHCAFFTKQVSSSARYCPGLKWSGNMYISNFSPGYDSNPNTLTVFAHAASHTS